MMCRGWLILRMEYMAVLGKNFDYHLYNIYIFL
jgi:hypothetical protein